MNAATLLKKSGTTGHTKIAAACSARRSNAAFNDIMTPGAHFREESTAQCTATLAPDIITANTNDGPNALRL